MIKLQILLQKPWRTPEGVEQVRKIIKSIGLKPTAKGSTTVSAEISKDSFEELFKTTATEVAAKPPGTRDFGKSGGHASGDLPVPEPLQKYVESITVASPYLRF